jgi:hypothetical protein
VRARGFRAGIFRIRTTRSRFRELCHEPASSTCGGGRHIDRNGLWEGVKVTVFLSFALAAAGVAQGDSIYITSLKKLSIEDLLNIEITSVS